MRSIILSLLIILTVPLLFSQTKAQESDELEAYIAQIREWRMTESARMSLRSVAGVLTETTILSFIKIEDSGMYGKRYESTSCPNPNMDATERKNRQSEYESKINPILKKLHPLADRDNSGFVTDEEGAQLRNLIEFAYQALYVASQEGANSEQFYTGMNLDKERFKQRVAEYNEVLLKARASDLELPNLSI